MSRFRLIPALFAALTLGGCYYSHHGDLRVQHNASIFANSVDDFRMTPQAVDRRTTYVMHVRDLRWGWYPTALRVMVDDEATARRMSPDEWKGVVLRLTLKTVDGRDLWAKTCDLSAMHIDAVYEWNGKWQVIYPLIRDIPADLPELRAYDVEMEVIKPSSHAGDQVALGSL